MKNTNFLCHFKRVYFRLYFYLRNKYQIDYLTTYRLNQDVVGWNQWSSKTSPNNFQTSLIHTRITFIRSFIIRIYNESKKKRIVSLLIRRFFRKPSNVQNWRVKSINRRLWFYWSKDFAREGWWVFTYRRPQYINGIRNQ